MENIPLPTRPPSMFYGPHVAQYSPYQDPTSPGVYHYDENGNAYTVARDHRVVWAPEHNVELYPEMCAFDEPPPPGMLRGIFPPRSPIFEANRLNNQPCLEWNWKAINETGLGLQWNWKLGMHRLPPGYTPQDLTRELFMSPDIPFKYPLVERCNDGFTQFRVHDIIMMAHDDARTEILATGGMVTLAARNEDRMYEIYAFGQGLFHCMSMLRLCKEHTPRSWFPLCAGLYRINIIYKRWEKLWRMTREQSAKKLPAFSAETLATFREESTRANKMCRCLHNGLMGECS
ncbi:hypothetical protein HD553DRAFT_343252 [Filobasidium floriforme]|uniref:uncharacterized protein n=2 Tax=Filobasidium floriforme TaxID=5210 RepID=UPI001E8CF6F3|nr:uncharacterized protein HD553DRAFT_343252 [Filobasidium floriforme]KAH8083250.1 hypothetical protein HD553DRAFT_343252 [Filobasidium floriforme]